MKQCKPLTDSPQHHTQPPHLLLHHHHHHFSKPSSFLLDNNSSSSPSSNTNYFASGFYYEPTSVLDANLTSSPNAAVTTTATTPATAAGPAGELALVPWGDAGSGDQHQHLLPAAATAADDWDPVAWFLSDRDDLSSFSKPQLHFPDDSCAPFIDSNFDLSSPFDPFSGDNVPPLPAAPVAAAAAAPSCDRAHLESLLRAAHCLETHDFATAHVILSRLNQQIPSAGGSPLQRAAFLFKEALLSLLRPSPAPADPPLSAAELVQRIDAQKTFSEISLVPHFAAFTAAQTLLEAFDAASAGGSIHLIDFEFGLGGQWSSFAQELAARSRASRSPPPAIRVTAVVAEESAETSLAADHLRDFARGLGLRLAVEFVRIGGLGAIALNGIRLSGTGEPVAIVLTPAIFRLLGAASGGATPDTAAAVLRFVRRSSPRAVVFVDPEFGAASGGGVASGGHSPSLHRSVAAGVEFYAALLESLEAGAAARRLGDAAVRRVERSVVRPRAAGSVADAAAPCRAGPWREAFAGAGWVPVQFSEFAESQAEWLVRHSPIDGYHVSRNEGALVLSWRGRDLAATSAWRC